MTSTSKDQFELRRRMPLTGSPTTPKQGHFEESNTVVTTKSLDEDELRQNSSLFDVIPHPLLDMVAAWVHEDKLRRWLDPIREKFTPLLPNRLRQTREGFQRLLRGEADLGQVAIGLEAVFARLLIGLWMFGLTKSFMEVMALFTLYKNQVEMLSTSPTNIVARLFNFVLPGPKFLQLFKFSFSLWFTVTVGYNFHKGTMSLGEASRLGCVLYLFRLIWTVIWGALFGRLYFTHVTIANEVELIVAFMGMWSVNSTMSVLIQAYDLELLSEREKFTTTTSQHQLSLTGLTTEVQDTLQDMAATVQQVFAHYPANPSFNIQYASVTNAIDTSVDNIRHLADLLGKLHDVERFDNGKLEVNWEPQMELFDVVSLTERIADAISATMDVKKLDFVVSAPVERGAQHFYLVKADKAVVAQILLKLLNFVAHVSPPQARIELNLQTSPPSMEQDGKFVTHVTFQIVYCFDPNLMDSKQEKSNTITEALVNQINGKITRHVRPDASMIDINFKMEVEQRDLPPRSSILPSYFTKQSANPLAAVSAEELLAFASLLNGTKAALLASQDTQFTQNMTSYLVDGFGMKLIYKATDSMAEVGKVLDEMDQLETERASHIPRLPKRMRQMVFIDDDWTMLDTALQHRAERRMLPNIIYFASPSHELRPQEFLQSTAAMAEGSPSGYFGPATIINGEAVAAPVTNTSSRVLIVTKPVGPRKLLAAIRQLLTDYEGGDDGGSDEEDQLRVRNGSLRRKVGNISSPVQALMDMTPTSPMNRPKPKTPVDNRKIETEEKPEEGKKKKKKDKTEDDVANAPVRPPINVLIAEDNPINQTILSTFLKKKGINVSVANNGSEAVEKWKNHKFHLVLMDIIMPVMDGIQATKEIRDLERHRREAQAQKGMFGFLSPDVVIVALTASSNADDRDAALAAGCNDFLTKPVSLVWLEKKIVEWGSMQALIDFANGVVDEKTPEFQLPTQVLQNPAVQDVVAPDMLPSVLQSISNEDPKAAEEAEARVEKEASSYERVEPFDNSGSRLETLEDTANLSQRELMQRLIKAGGLEGADRVSESK